MMDVINKCMGWCSHRYTHMAARILIAAIFIIVGGSKLLNFTQTADFITSAGFPMGTVLTALAIIFELGGGIMLAIGFKERIAIPMLLIFTIAATALFHIKGLTTDQTQMVMFLKNLAIVGGLLALYRSCNCNETDCKTCSVQA